MNKATTPSFPLTYFFNATNGTKPSPVYNLLTIKMYLSTKRTQMAEEVNKLKFLFLETLKKIQLKH